MNTLLKKAFEEISSRPDDEQEYIASVILDELADEAEWQAKFQRGKSKLEALALEALAQHERGETKPLAFDRN